MYCDIYDGNVWKELQYINCIPFLLAPHKYCLTLNVDWFNPSKQTEYSAGAIYLAIQTLLRSEQYKISECYIVVNQTSYHTSPVSMIDREKLPQAY